MLFTILEFMQEFAHRVAEVEGTWLLVQPFNQIVVKIHVYSTVVHQYHHV